MLVNYVYSNDRLNEINFPKALIPAGRDTFFPHHFQSSPCDNLIELAGRVCYDSTQSEKTRGSADYHKHINDVNHGSVQEHVNITVEKIVKGAIDGSSLILHVFECLNRPGVFVETNVHQVENLSDPVYFRVTANIRAIREWFNFGLTSDINGVGGALLLEANKLCPLAMNGIKIPKQNPNLDEWHLSEPRFDSEIWVSYYLSDISRGLSHELVRHKYKTGVSQRSTRYVDESESEWAWHPLLLKYEKDFLDYLETDVFDKLEEIAQSPKYRYRQAVAFLELTLLKEGVDKFTARKQARGAARGILGNALSTEMIFSASIDEWKRIIKQRCNDAADAEIRMMASEVYKDLKTRYPNRFAGWTERAASDTFGLHVTCPI